MPDSLKDTLRTTLAETTTPQSAPVQETKQEPVVAAPAETQSGDTAEKEYVSGIDISDVPEQYRPQVREKLSQKAKLLETGYNGKFQEVAALKKDKEYLSSLGVSVDEARDAVIKYAESKRQPQTTTQEKKSAMKLLDSLIDGAPVEQRPALQQMRQIIHEETDVQKLSQKLDRLESFMNASVMDSSLRRQSELNTELNSLYERYGQEFVDKYRDDVLKHGMQNKVSARKLLQAIAPEDELEQAITAKVAKPGKTLTKEKANAISSPTTGVASSIEHIDTKKVSLKGLISELVKQ